MLRSLTLFVIFLIAPLTLCAQTATVTPTATAAASVTLNLIPIDTRFSTIDGLTYTQSGDEVKSYQDFHQIFDPINDFETERLINHSESTQVTSKLVESAGLIGVVAGVAGLLTSSSNQQTPWWITAAGGAVVFDIGTFFGADAQTSRFNAVQRYNRFAYGREQVLPQAPADEKSMLPVAAPSVAATPSATVTPDIKGQVNAH
ncbi:MAG TPA: hypothetical protein VN963_09920, partial [bacterium]|nr:hypothetical protein [bacterium]